MKNKKLLQVLSFLRAVLAVVSFFGILLIGFNYPLLEDGKPFTIRILLWAASLYLIGFLLYVSFYQIFFDEDTFETLHEERKAIISKLEEQKNNSSNVIETVQLSLNHLNEYYVINKNQAKRSYTLSVMSILLGTIVLTVTILLSVSNKISITTTTISSLSAILLEFIGGSYFFLYKKSLEQLNLFYSQLIKLQNIMLCISLADSTSNPDKTTEIKEKIVLSILEKNNV
jgi:hypothetical protein